MSSLHRPWLLVLLLAACQSEPRAPEAPPRLLVVTQIAGVTEPCGCTSKPLGGLDRLVGRVEEKRARGPSALVLAGDMFWEHEEPAPHLAEQELRRAKVLGSVLTKLQPLTLAAGPVDSVHGGARDDEGRLARIGSLMVGVISTARVQACEALDTRATALRRGGAKLVIAAVGVADDAARACAEKLEKVDVLIAPGGDQVQEPRQVGRVTWIEAGDRGRYLGTVTFHPTVEESDWTYFDGGRSARASLDARIDRLRQEVADLEEGEAKRVRQVKLSELEAQRGATSGAPPASAYFTYEVEPIGRDVKPAEWARQALAEYNASLCDITKASTAARECTSAASPNHEYVGDEACRACHASAFAVYAKTKHAHAWATLTAAGKTCDLGCIGCHTVGYEQPGGYCRVADAERWKNVGCESCHGPGKGHTASPGKRELWAPGFGKRSEATTCTGCHNSEHSDQFDFAKYLPQILGPGHGAPAN